MRKYLFGLMVVSCAIYLAKKNYTEFIRDRDRVRKNFKTVETKFGKVEYLDLGDKSRPVILFSSGGGAGIDSVYAFDWLLENNYRVISINRPGYYNTSIGRDDSIRQHADSYHEVIKALDIEEVSVFGLSMGGLSALYYAESYPVKSLVLWSAVTGPYQPNEESVESTLGKLIMTDKAKDILSWGMLETAYYFPKLLMKQLLKAEAMMDGDEIKHMVDTEFKDKSASTQFKLFIESLTPMSALYPGMMNELKKSAKPDQIDWCQIDCPVLAVHSTIDKDVGYSHLLRLKRHLPDSKIVTVQAGGHFVWWGRDGKEVIDETGRFFKNTTAIDGER